MKKNWAILILFFIIAMQARAEYRVYQYLVKNKVVNQDQPLSSLQTSTLNPVSFKAYNGGGNFIQVDLLRTWICPGHTAKQDICPSPYTAAVEI